VSLVVETRPERVLYNAEVTLRMVDQLLAELGGEPLPIPTSPRDRSVVERVSHALSLVEMLGTGGSDCRQMGIRLREMLKTELRTLLKDLPAHAEEPRADSACPTTTDADRTPTVHN